MAFLEIGCYSKLVRTSSLLGPIALNLLEGCESPIDVCKLNALGGLFCLEVGACMAFHHLAIGQLISYLIRCAQEAEDREVQLQCNLDDAVIQVEELEGEVWAGAFHG